MNKLIGLLIISSYLGIAAATPNYQELVDQAYTNYKLNNHGEVANYIPALAKYNPKLYGIAIATADGKIYAAGDSNTKFPLESLSKIFTLALALDQYGASQILAKIGASATGLPFNSVTAVEMQPNHTGNALVNAGAMALVSLIKGKDSNAKWATIHHNLNNFANSNLTLNQEVYASEMKTNHHNQGIATLLQSYASFYSEPQEAVDLYTRQCSIEVTTLELAKMGAVLANYGKSPFNQQQILAKPLVNNVLALMATAGLYTASGNWLYSVGIPAKSGVSGGILAIVPGKFAIAAYSPPLDKDSNSERAQLAIRYIASKTNASIFNQE